MILTELKQKFTPELRRNLMPPTINESRQSPIMIICDNGLCTRRDASPYQHPACYFGADDSCDGSHLPLGLITRSTRCPSHMPGSAAAG
jgi:hypothetical protein